MLLPLPQLLPNLNWLHHTQLYSSVGATCLAVLAFLPLLLKHVHAAVVLMASCWQKRERRLLHTAYLKRDLFMQQVFGWQFVCACRIRLHSGRGHVSSCLTVDKPFKCHFATFLAVLAAKYMYIVAYAYLLLLVVSLATCVYVYVYR